MKPRHFLTAWLLAAPFLVSAEDPSSIRERTITALAKLPVEAHFDQDYAGLSNPKQMLDLFLPKERTADEKLPVLVFIHGGGWTGGDRGPSAGAVLPFVASGHYAGITVSYRLAPEAHWPAQIHDCKAAIRWIRGNAETFGLDASRIAVWGSSAGGHLVSLLGTTHGVAELEGEIGPFAAESSQVTCVINQCGPMDFSKALMFADGKPVVEDPAVVALIGGSVAENPDLIKAVSPVTYVTPNDAPFLTLHGMKDKRVDFVQATAIETALEAAGVPSILIGVTEGGHGLSHPALKDRIKTFLDSHLHGGSETLKDETLAEAP
jgi:acetyl esterase/lipase